MTLDEAPLFAQALGNKAPGHLITASDWNRVMEMLPDWTSRVYMHGIPGPGIGLSFCAGHTVPVEDGLGMPFWRPAEGE